MGLLDLFRGNAVKDAGGAVKDTLSGVGGLARDIRTAITGKLDPEREAELQGKMLDLEAGVIKAQLQVNAEEAQHKSVFVAGWRPAIGWCGAIGLLYQFLLRPLLVGLAKVEMPELELSQIITLITGMLGLGLMRTSEKFGGVQDKH